VTSASDQRNRAARAELDEDRIATLWLDSPGKSVNTLSKQMWEDLDNAIDQIEREKPRGVIVASAKPRSFIAGADLFEMREMSNEQLDHYLAEGQRILNRLENLPMPTVAAINGDALGGGLEVALACRARVAVDDAKIQLGLPETKLGLIPGWGGTVRLPRLIGLEEALPLMTQGKSIAPAQAKKLGLVDAVASRDELIQAAKQQLNAPSRPARDDQRHDELLQKSAASVRARSGDSLPAPLRLIEVVRTRIEQGIDAGFAAERRALIELRESEAGRNLMRMFFLRTGAKKAAAEAAGGRPRDIASAAVIGGGTMGAGIAHALVRGGIRSDVLEVNVAAADAAANHIRDLLMEDVEKGRLDPDVARSSLGESVVGSDWSVIASADFVIEAVVERLDAKIEVFRRLDQTISPGAILASNTSSLSITQIAQATKHPQRVIGLHFFNPVPKMPLVEVVRTNLSDSAAVATGVALAVKLGKTPVVVNDSPGFVVNRVLFPYLAEALRMAHDAQSILSVDAAMKAWGWPMGQFELMDTIGLDVTLMILDALSPHFGERFAATEYLRRAVGNGWLGAKSGRGFYIHPLDKIAPQVNPDLELREPNFSLNQSEIQQRLMQVMRDEVQRVLKENVVASPDAVDFVLVLGLGFPAFRRLT
jgi:3-hydroxyacyl-CoA dehydrogenase/enoyl-CoA hydratase/3-hydroxybutyryl-CoA epimerase